MPLITLHYRVSIFALLIQTTLHQACYKSTQTHTAYNKKSILYVYNIKIWKWVNLLYTSYRHNYVTLIKLKFIWLLYPGIYWLPGTDLLEGHNHTRHFNRLLIDWIPGDSNNEYVSIFNLFTMMRDKSLRNLYCFMSVIRWIYIKYKMVKSMMKQNIRRDRKILTIVPIKYCLFRVQAFKDKHYQQCRIQDFKWELEGFWCSLMITWSILIQHGKYIQAHNKTSPSKCMVVRTCPWSIALPPPPQYELSWSGH